MGEGKGRALSRRSFGPWRIIGGAAEERQVAADAFMAIVFELLEQLYHSASPEGNRADGFSEQPWRISRLVI